MWIAYWLPDANSTSGSVPITTVNLSPCKPKSPSASSTDSPTVPTVSSTDKSPERPTKQQTETAEARSEPVAARRAGCRRRSPARQTVRRQNTSLRRAKARCGQGLGFFGKLTGRYAIADKHHDEPGFTVRRHHIATNCRLAERPRFYLVERRLVRRYRLWHKQRQIDAAFYRDQIIYRRRRHHDPRRWCSLAASTSDQCAIAYRGKQLLPRLWLDANQRHPQRAKA